MGQKKKLNFVDKCYWTVFLYQGPTFPVVSTCQILHMHYFWVYFHEQDSSFSGLLQLEKNILIFHCVMLLLPELIKPSDSKFITSVLVFCSALGQYIFLAIHLLTCIHTTLHNVTCSANVFWIYWHLFKYSHTKLPLLHCIIDIQPWKQMKNIKVYWGWSGKLPFCKNNILKLKLP